MGTESASSALLGKRLYALVVRTAVLALTTGVVAAAFSLMLPNTYRADATLLLSPLPLNQPEPKNNPGDKITKTPAMEVGFLVVKSLSIPDYRILLMNDDIVSKLRDRMAALLAASGKSTKEIPIETVRNAMRVDTRVFKQTVYDIEYQPVIELLVEAPSPEIAAELANEWGRLSVELAAGLTIKGREGLLEFLKKTLADKTAELQVVEKEIEALDGRMDVDIWKKRMEQLEESATKLEIDRTRLNTEIARAQGEGDELRKQMESITEIHTLRRAPPDEAYWLMADKAGKVDPSKVLASEEVNDVYISVREQEVLTQSELQGKLQEKTSIETALQSLKQELAVKQQELANQQRLRSNAKLRLEALQSQYTQVALSYGAAQIAEAEKTPDLKIVSEAVPPERKIGPHRTLIVFVAIVLGALIAPLHFLLSAALRNYAKILDGRLAAAG